MSWRLIGCCVSSNQPKASGTKLPSSVTSCLDPAPSVTMKREVLRPGPISPGRVGGAGSANTAQLAVGAGDGRLQAGRDLARPVEHAVGVEPARSASPCRATVQFPSRLMAASVHAARRPPVAGSRATTVRPSVTRIDGPVGAAAGTDVDVLGDASGAGATDGSGSAWTVASARSGPPQPRPELSRAPTRLPARRARARMLLLHRAPSSRSDSPVPTHPVSTVSATAMAASRSKADSSR